MAVDYRPGNTPPEGTLHRFTRSTPRTSPVSTETQSAQPAGETLETGGASVRHREADLPSPSDPSPRPSASRRAPIFTPQVDRLLLQTFESDFERFERVKHSRFFEDEDLTWWLERIEAERELAILEDQLNGCFGQIRELWNLENRPGEDLIRIYSQLGRVYAILSALTHQIARVRGRLP